MGEEEVKKVLSDLARSNKELANKIKALEVRINSLERQHGLHAV